MEQKIFPLANRGMNRDTSISKEKNEFAYENHNIRILARDHNTLLSVSNERGNKKLEDLPIKGTVIGWNVLNEYIILFTTRVEPNNGEWRSVDRIYRVKYDKKSRPQFTKILIFEGSLGFDVHCPIESVVDFESEDILKIYWVDGINVLRFLNFSDKYLSNHGTVDEDGSTPVLTDSTLFDSTRSPKTNLSVKITREGGGNTRLNGVAQYFVTYYNKNGQQTGIVYSSPLVYLSPEGRGGAADETNTNRIVIEVENVDTSFEYIRLYQILRTSQDVTNTAFLVDERLTSDESVKFVDRGTPLESIDVTSLLYLGSKEVLAGTLTHKDNTLFLGNLKSIGNASIEELSDAIHNNAFKSNHIESDIVQFAYSDNASYDTLHIPYISAEGYYPYENQLSHHNSEITTFKGGEKYRFALRFYRSNGTYTKSFWIGDKVNSLYPQITDAGIKRAIAVCNIPKAILDAAGEFSSVQLMIAQADYSDRSVLAQGIVSPTVFNLYNRFRNQPYSQASWIYRPKGGGYSSIHYSPLANSNSKYAEIQNMYWASEDPTPSPLYYVDEDGNLIDEPKGLPDVDGVSLFYSFIVGGARKKNYLVYIGGITVKYSKDGVEVEDARKEYTIHSISYTTTEKNLSAFIDEISKVYVQENIPTEARIHEDRWRELLDGSEQIVLITDPPTLGDWFPLDYSISDAGTLVASYGKEYYFVDENIITLNSPEIEYEKVNVDKNRGLKFRIVGVSRFTGNISDYSITADNFSYEGERVVKINASSENITDNIEGMSAWPLYIEHSAVIQTEQDDPESEEILVPTAPGLSGTDVYMMYMWHKSGSIPEIEFNGVKLSTIKNKLFANLHFSYYTIYNNYGENEWEHNGEVDDLRQFNSLSTQIYSLKISGSDVNYMANVDELSVMPVDVKYPIFYSATPQYSYEDALSLKNDESNDTQTPIPITYSSKPHAVIVLPNTESGNVILPYLSSDEAYAEDDGDSGFGPYAPWRKRDESDDTSGIEPTPVQEQFDIDTTYLPEGSKYMFIGELYFDFDGGDIEDDTRYGGTSESAVEHNTFIPAGPKKSLSGGLQTLQVIGNEGDTFFQRWDSVKTLPRSTDDINQVVDVASVMIETHINLDGRTDLDRGSTKLAYIDWDKFGVFNPVYSQANNFQLGFDTDESLDLDSYRTYITWSTEKFPNSEIDEWTHIPLTTSLKLDGDKGQISALRRFQNSIISFQEKGIAEILFNSRTQISTTEGIPVEIANSGKVDGKRYLTNKYGTLNKWSIVEGKTGLFFVDDINKIIGVLNTDGVRSLSTEQGFDAWVRDNYTTSEWNPETFENFVSYYDKVHSDVYFIKNGKSKQPCLVYSEILGRFVSFYDYSNVSMMTNIEDRFISSRLGEYGFSYLWLQNEGLYGRFFDTDRPFWVTWRVVPDNLTDKIWTNLEYRADFMRVLDGCGHNVISESDMVDGGVDSVVADKTFDSFEIWNEYQTTGEQFIHHRTSALWKDRYPDVAKRFRIWRFEIPRAIKSVISGNRFGLDRIRNPWVYVKLKKNEGNFGQEMLQLHDVVVKYFENQ